MGLQSWYDAHIVPRFIRCACGTEQIMELRGEVVPHACGKVFELGCGGGLNQRYYDAARVTGFSGVDPSPKLLDYAREQAGRKGWQVDIRAGTGEDIPFADASFDTVVSTFTLCSVQDQAKTIAELRRVLKPGGTLLFLEHGRAPDAGVRRWQERIEPVWKRLAGGCHLTRPVTGALEAGGFKVEPAGQSYMPKVPRFAGWMEWGSARAA
jgi:SAM-dependent methyltransferase